LIVKNSRLSM